jgi:hypothetical protein
MGIDDVARALEPFGLSVRGHFRPEPADGVPALPDGRPAAAVLMVGNAGPALWRRFAGARPGGPSPLDRWTRDVLTGVAEPSGAHAVFPFQRPYLPFQRWSLRAEPCHVSPLGILIHPEFGLWHALRGALLFADEIAPGINPPAAAPRPSPCDACPERPCLNTCPVQAFSETGYDVPRCLARLADSAGADCLDLGCRARRACPVGAGYRYDPAQARFHMEAFRQACGGS